MQWMTSHNCNKTFIFTLLFLLYIIVILTIQTNQVFADNNWKSVNPNFLQNEQSSYLKQNSYQLKQNQEENGFINSENKVIENRALNWNNLITKIEKIGIALNFVFTEVFPLMKRYEYIDDNNLKLHFPETYAKLRSSLNQNINQVQNINQNQNRFNIGINNKVNNIENNDEMNSKNSNYEKHFDLRRKQHIDQILSSHDSSKVFYALHIYFTQIKQQISNAWSQLFNTEPHVSSSFHSREYNEFNQFEELSPEKQQELENLQKYIISNQEDSYFDSLSEEGESVSSKKGEEEEEEEEIGDEDYEENESDDYFDVMELLNNNIDDEPLWNETCGDGIDVSFDNITYFCNDTQVTFEEFEELEDEPEFNCTEKLNTTRTCICPLDFHGPQCQYRRRWRCITQLLEPKRDCESTPTEYGKPIDEDPPCLIFRTDQSVEFIMNMTCYFIEPPDLKNGTIPPDANYTIIGGGGAEPWQLNETFTLEEIRDMFEYFVLKEEENLEDNFAISRDPEKPFLFHVINFYRLGDIRLQFQTNLTAEHWLGIDTIDIPLDFESMALTVGTSEFQEKWLAGNRLYAEAGVRRVPRLNMIFERIFVDFEDLEEPMKPLSNTDKILMGVLIPVGIIIIAAVVISIIIWQYRQYSKKFRQQQRRLVTHRY